MNTRSGSGRGIPVLFELERGGCCRFEHMAPCQKTQNEGPLTSRRLMLCFSCRTHRGSDDGDHHHEHGAQQAGDEREWVRGAVVVRGGAVFTAEIVQ